ncbi:hypothetical protein Y886_07925 [Xanthomonas hyacinthi DSM 19077]|nr:hypothetical protein Y886_07925 [Xanthomonas hyacinthi DSM 19077]
MLGGLLAMFLRWYFVTHAQVLQPLFRDSNWGDAGQYYRYAWNLFHHGLFSSAAPGSANPISDGFRDPAYPVFLALGMAITDNYDHWYTLVILSQTVLGAVTVTCVILAIRDALPTWLLVVAALAMAVWPHLVSIPAYVLSENLTAPLCAISALALREAAVRRSMGYVLVAGVSMALAALSNAVLGPLAVVLACTFASKRSLPPRLLLVLVAVSTLPLLAWGIRNSHLTAPLSPAIRVEMNLVQGSWPTYHAAAQLASVEDPVGVQTIDAMNLEMATLHIDRVEGLKAMAARMGHAPGTYLAWYLSKPALLWGWEIGLGAGDIYMYPTHNSPFVTNPIFKAIEAVTFIFNGVLALLALAGLIVVALRRDPPAALITFAVTAAWVTVVYGVLQSDPRYSTPYRAAEIVLACVAVSFIVTYLRKRVVGTQDPS